VNETRVSFTRPFTRLRASTRELTRVVTTRVVARAFSELYDAWWRFPMIERDVLINLRVSGDEREKLRAIAHANDETMAQTIRRFIKQRFEAQFGADASPRPIVKRRTK
jgi:hypothetical protein